jgi:hypothetical protein
MKLDPGVGIDAFISRRAQAEAVIVSILSRLEMTPWNRANWGRRDLFYFCYILAGPGTGKSRFLDEVMDYIRRAKRLLRSPEFKKPLLLNITFNSSTSFCVSAEGKHDPLESVSRRIAHGLGWDSIWN